MKVASATVALDRCLARLRDGRDLVAVIMAWACRALRAGRAAQSVVGIEAVMSALAARLLAGVNVATCDEAP